MAETLSKYTLIRESLSVLDYLVTSCDDDEYESEVKRDRKTTERLKKK